MALPVSPALTLGHTWAEVRKGASVFVMANHGALMVVAPHRQAHSYP